MLRIGARQRPRRQGGAGVPSPRAPRNIDRRIGSPTECRTRPGGDRSLAPLTDLAAASWEWLFDHQRELTRANIWEAAQRLASLRLAQADHDAAMADVRESARQGEALGVKVASAPRLDGLTAVLEAERQRLGLVLGK